MSAVSAADLHSRALLTGYFLGLGAIMAVWGARMPAVQQTAHLSTAELALVLLAAAIGMVSQASRPEAATPARRGYPPCSLPGPSPWPDASSSWATARASPRCWRRLSRSASPTASSM